MKSKSMCTMYIIRHAQSEANVRETFENSGLTALGKQQAERLSKKFKKIHIDAIFSSDLIRTIRTAEVIALEKKLEISTTKVIRERSWGSLTNKTGPELRKKFKELFDEFEKMTDQEKFKWKIVDDMESAEEAVSRFITFLREIAVAYLGKTVLITSHGTVMRSFLIHLGYATFKELPVGTIENAAVVKLESDGIDFFVKQTSGVNKKNKIYM
ncbi:MAG: histidine phosphatase family protein [Patescibacteria group bacterium]|nr:histidine phosphatase family protein [Patescibacteria group bacterium]